MLEDPEQPAGRNSRQLGALLKTLVSGELPLEKETSRFILASALDVFMTYILLRQGNFVESNPIALYFLNSWGVRGLVYIKFAVVAFVVVIAQVVARWKKETARRLLNFGTLVVVFVVIYSFTLYLRQM